MKYGHQDRLGDKRQENLQIPLIETLWRTQHQIETEEGLMKASEMVKDKWEDIEELVEMDGL